MNISTTVKNNVSIALVQSDEILIKDAQTALDMLATVRYETGCNGIVLWKASIAEEFFKLSTGLAGEVLQKFINYHMKLAIVGDFSGYTSKPLKDFIYESNHGKDVFFVATREEAIEKLVTLK
jgi:hypothetical protein